MKVSLLDLKAQYRQIKPEVERVIAEVCDSQHFVMGPQVTELEAKIAAYSQAKHGIGVSSGTDALLVALMVLEIGPGDEVITSPFTFFATGGVIARLNARPIFCDIDPATYNLSPAAVGRFLAERCEIRNGSVLNKATGGTVRALMPVHLFGQMADMDGLMAIAREYGLAVIEDGAQAVGSALPDGRRAGSIGDIGCLSFFPSKNLGAFGDGGMCVTNDDRLNESLQILRVHGGKPKYYHSVIGGNFRLDALQAAILLVKLRYLDEWTQARQRNARAYDELLATAKLPQVEPPTLVPGARHIFNQYVIRAERRDALRSFLTEQGVGTEIYYPVPLHIQKCFAYLGMRAEDCPESTKAADSVLALPIYPELPREELHYVVEMIGKYYRKR
jgi:dTDP-4-amino-4,6-dideoxygalactose transaminase